MKQRKWMKLLAVMFAVVLVLGQAVGDGANAFAAKKKSLNITKLTLSVGGSRKLKVSGVKAGKVTWSSSRKSVASVSRTGKVKAKKPGKTTITAKFPGGKRKCRVTVKKNVNSAVKNTQVPAETSLAATASPAADTSSKPAASGTPAPAKTPAPGQPSASNGSKILVAYFSWSGTSERIAGNIIARTGADSFRIEREVPYSADYQTTAYGDAKTEADTNARPAIKDPLASVAQYDKIILCYPIWWHTAPMTVGTFLEHYDLTGKTIYPVAQSASMDRSQYETSLEFIRGCAKGAVVDDGIFTKDNAAIQTYADRIVNG